jgi:hypothetical protein
MKKKRKKKLTILIFIRNPMKISLNWLKRFLKRNPNLNNPLPTTHPEEKED